ncbi:MAG: DUF488 family protein [Candidatus Brachytrichaceae bacterium NZ_4S206]|jgi:uncharacterized protein (DUF488 family)
MYVFTLGYQGLSLERFVGILEEHHVDILIDVRDYPYSRKPGFSQVSLQHSLESRGIRYFHVKALGAPKSIRDAYRRSADWTRYSTDYKKYLSSQMRDLVQVMRLATSKICCLMCFEANPNQCHRLYVAAELERLSSGKLQVIHLTGQDLVDSLHLSYASVGISDR